MASVRSWANADMHFGDLQPGVFLARSNTFLARVETAGEETLAHLPNSGRLTEIMSPGGRIWLRRIPYREGRRTTLDVVLMENADGIWVGVDTRLPPGLLTEAVERGLVPPFTNATRVKREVRLGQSRIDLQLDHWLVETKSVTLVRQGTGLFPDAPTTRGTRHLQELREGARQGFPTMVAFVVQRPDAHRVVAHADVDPEFAHQLKLAATQGVAVRAFVCQVESDQLFITGEIPVEL